MMKNKSKSIWNLWIICLAVEQIRLVLLITAQGLANINLPLAYIVHLLHSPFHVPPPPLFPGSG
ncbi:hypothetical protein BDV28DRAFT_143112 [Aspergillus coremiiformis]|uniref:Uncharacterized protein n=1 Tax=Aspergillus coremiiformis TaxID=138285 RepID=A0A5N6YUP7_9EURO|nr:hypothetical protein BDV28DRAFT_143112 [Aspergillus coremiiformis]